MQMKSVLVVVVFASVLSLALTDKKPQRCECPMKNKIFYPMDEKVSWIEAVVWCKLYNLELATITSMAENLQAVTIIKQSGLKLQSVWIGASEVKHNGFYMGVSTGEGLSFSNWSAGQPNRRNQSEHCVEMALSDAKWNDIPCNSLRPFICEKNCLD